MSECEINGKGALHLLTGLKKCPTLFEIKAYKSDFSMRYVRRVVDQGLSTSLRFIYLDNCKLGSQGAIGVYNAIIRNKNIKKISLKNN